MSLDDKAWQTSLFGTHLGLVVRPPPPIPFLSPLLFITPTRATQPSSLSTAPIHQHTAITCRRSVIDYFSCADVLAYQTLRKWQIRSLCPVMIIWVLLFYILVFIQYKFVLCYIRSIFHCTSKEGKKEEGRRVGSLFMRRDMREEVNKGYTHKRAFSWKENLCMLLHCILYVLSYIFSTNYWW